MSEPTLFIQNSTNPVVCRQQEYAVVLCWVIWCFIHTVVMVVLAVLSFFTLLRHIPARVILHLLAAALALWSSTVMYRLYR